MLVDGALGELAAAGQGHMGGAEPAEQGAHQVIACTELLHQGVLGPGGRDIGGVDLHNIQFRTGDLCAHTAQDVQQNTDIGNVRHILNADLTSDQQRCGENGDDGVLCAADGNGAFQLVTAVNFISSQG